MGLFYKFSVAPIGRIWLNLTKTTGRHLLQFKVAKTLSDRSEIIKLPSNTYLHVAISGWFGVWPNDWIYKQPRDYYKIRYQTPFNLGILALRSNVVFRADSCSRALPSMPYSATTCALLKKIGVFVCLACGFGQIWSNSTNLRYCKNLQNSPSGPF